LSLFLRFWTDSLVDGFLSFRAFPAHMAWWLMRPALTSPSPALEQMNTQLIPPSSQVLATMPSGREIHSLKPYVPPSLEEDVLVRMRAPADGPGDVVFGADGDSSSEEGVEERKDLPGAFPTGRSAYGGEGESAYY